MPLFRCTSGHLIFCRELNCTISDIGFQVQFNAEFRSKVMVFLQSHIKITKKENRNNIVCFYPARAPESPFKVNLQNGHCVGSVSE